MALTRVLRALCVFGVLDEDCTGRFSLTEVGQLLRTDVPSSFRDAIRFMAGPTRWRCWAELLETVRSGINRPEAALGMQLDLGVVWQISIRLSMYHVLPRLQAAKHRLTAGIGH